MSVSSSQADGGDIEIESAEYGTDKVVETDRWRRTLGGLVILPDELKDRRVNLAERCALQLQGDGSSFFINGQVCLPI